MKYKKLSCSAEKVRNFLHFNHERWVSPTEIGNEVGGYVLTGNPYQGYHELRHSAWASPICLRLVKYGWAVRNKKGWYRIAGWRYMK